MRRILLPALLLLPTIPGCGLFLQPALEKNERGLYEFPKDDEPPHAILIEGEIRDFLTLHAERTAIIEVRTSEPGYTPVATLDQTGHFSLAIDVCRKERTTGDQVAQQVLLGQTGRCDRWLEEYRFRARVGDRCSLSYGTHRPIGGARPLVLWIHQPCDEAKL